MYGDFESTPKRMSSKRPKKVNPSKSGKGGNDNDPISQSNDKLVVEGENTEGTERVATDETDQQKSNKAVSKEEKTPPEVEELPNLQRDNNTDNEQIEANEGNNDIDIAKVEECWMDVVKEIQKYNGHLYAFLKAAKVSELENGYLVLEVPFNFHKERIESPKSREAINGVLVDIIGSPLAIRCNVNETIQRKKPSSADVVLKNIQMTQQNLNKETEQAPSDEVVQKKAPPKPRKVSKKVEAIFADL